MTTHLSTPAITAIADLREAPPQTMVDRSFGLPTLLYGLTVGSYFAFLAIMAIGLATRELIIPIGICVVYITMAFGVPSLWARMKPDHRSRPQSMGQFSLYGIETYTGRVTARDAMIQVLILPVIILFWGVAVVIIAALV
jgi:hypothetical protein